MEAVEMCICFGRAESVTDAPADQWLRMLGCAWV